MTNILVLVSLILAFPIIFLGALKKPAYGIAVLLFMLPMFSQTYRLFTQMPFPSIETLAVFVLWVAVTFHDFSGKKPFVNDFFVNIASGVFLLAGLLSANFAHDSEIAYKILLAGGVAPLLCFSIASKNILSIQDMELVILGYFGLVIQTFIFTMLAFNIRQGLAPTDVDLASWLYIQSNPVVAFGTPSVTIATMVASIPLTAWYRIYGGRNKNLLWLVISISTIYVAILSLSRGSWLGMLVAMIGSLPLYFKRIRISFLVMIIVILLGLYYSGYYDLFLELINFRLGNPINTVDIRVANYQLALLSSSQHILFGLGLGNYRFVYLEFPLALASQLDPLWFAHNLFLTLIPEIGVIGTIGFIYIFLSRLIKGAILFRVTTDEKLHWLIYSLLVAVISYIVIVSTSGGHLVATLSENLTAPALIVNLIFMGCLSSYLVRFSQLNNRIDIRL